MKPKVSVIMPVYNDEKYVARAIDSILQQTFADFELLIINDGSSDRSPQIARNYRDSRIKVFDNEKNRKLVATLNRGLSLAQGEYIARMDSDDISMPERLERQITFLEKNPETDLLGTAYLIIDDNNKVLMERPVLTENNEIQKSLPESNQFAHGSVVFRKSCLEKAGMYRLHVGQAEDYDMWLRIASCGKVANLAQYLYRWRLSTGIVSINKQIRRMSEVYLVQYLAKERKKQGKDSVEREGNKAMERIIQNIPKSITVNYKQQAVKACSYWVGEFLLHDNYRDAFTLCRQFIKEYRYHPIAWKLLIKTILYRILPSSIFQSIRKIRNVS